MSLINDLKTIPQFGVAALVDNSSNSVYLFFSNSLFTLFCTHIHKLKLKVHDNPALQNAFNDNDLELRVLKEYDADPGTIALRTDYKVLLDSFIVKGYKDMREGYKPIGYKLKTYILADYRVSSSPTPLVYVAGRSPNTKEIVLGIFESIPQADEWITSTYGQNRNDILPVFANNDLTVAYIEKHGYNLLR